jgi:hypothetical protein
MERERERDRYYIAWLPLTFTVIGQDNFMNIYYQSEILSSPHGITAYESVESKTI